MKATKLFVAVLGALIFILVLQVLKVLHYNASTPRKISAAVALERAMCETDFCSRVKALNEEYSQKKYLATGATVYDRIFNKSGQTDVDLLLAMAREAFPKEWAIEVRVEEFTHYLLCLSMPPGAPRVQPDAVGRQLLPLLNNCGWLLQYVAVFDGMHKCCLFFDKETLAALSKESTITPEQVARSIRQGDSFSQFNSMTVACKNQGEHLFVPVQISGDRGLVLSYMLLDTGASTTMFSLDTYRKTNHEKLTTVQKRKFNTANGIISCPIVSRTVSVEGVTKTIDVAVNQENVVDLLGLNFFIGLKYLVDMPNSCLYIWHQESSPQPNVDPSTLPSAEEVAKLHATNDPPCISGPISQKHSLLSPGNQPFETCQQTSPSVVVPTSEDKPMYPSFVQEEQISNRVPDVTYLSSNPVVNKGDSKEHVDKLLGASKGWKADNEETAYYERGYVVFRDGKAVKFSILSDSELLRKRNRQGQSQP